MRLILSSLFVAAAISSLTRGMVVSPEQAPFQAKPAELKVNVTLFVMSRCPDARQCESVFEDVFKTKGIADKVNLQMGYIATANSSEPLGVTCKHGELECLGNAHQLCLHRHLDLPIFYANLACQDYQKFPGDIGRLSLTKQCAASSKVDWETSGVGRCIEGKHPKEGRLGREARRLLLDNAKWVKAEGVSTSCTIRIDSTLVKGGQRSCVVDDGTWKGCDDGHAAADFVRVIEAEYKNLQAHSM